jgi:hypothetical protein
MVCSFQFLVWFQILLLSAVLAQQVRNVRVIFCDRQLQWSFPFVVLGVHIGLVIQQQFRNILDDRNLSLAISAVARFALTGLLALSSYLDSLSFSTTSEQDSDQLSNCAAEQHRNCQKDIHDQFDPKQVVIGWVSNSSDDGHDRKEGHRSESGDPKSVRDSKAATKAYQH